MDHHTTQEEKSGDGMSVENALFALESAAYVYEPAPIDRAVFSAAHAILEDPDLGNEEMVDTRRIAEHIEEHTNFTRIIEAVRSLISSLTEQRLQQLEEKGAAGQQLAAKFRTVIDALPQK